MVLSFIEGNEAVAYGALAGGCRFFAGYPITPATTIFNMMLKLLPPQGGVCLQGEDEIASMGFCIGASMAGWKVMTATSGPGLSLCSEQISFQWEVKFHWLLWMFSGWDQAPGLPQRVLMVISSFYSGVIAADSQESCLHRWMQKTVTF